MRKKTFLIAFAVIAVSYRAAEAAFTFDDIPASNWYGTGANSAAMVITWRAPEVLDGSSVTPPTQTLTMVWGYHFDGAKKGEDMFNAILAGDHNLFAMVSGTTQYGKAVFALGYDEDHNGTYGITNGTTTYDATYFLSHSGLVAGSYSTPDHYNSTDSGDLYWGGWYGPNWELWKQHTLGTSEPDRGTNPYWSGNGFSGSHGQWDYASVGMSSMTLSDGSWMGWTVAAGGLGASTAGTAAWQSDKAAPALAAVPEPASLGILLVGSLGLLARRRCAVK
jgi:hypothetical protein